MHVTLDTIKSMVTGSELTKGKRMYENGQVLNLTRIQDGDDIKYTCTVKDGLYMNNVQVLFGVKEVRSYCPCQGWTGEDYWMCEHVGAALYAIMEKQEASSPINASNSDNFAQRVMRRYLDLDMNPRASKEQLGTAKLIPKLDLAHSGESYPSFVLTVGIDRMYMVKNVREFASDVTNRRTTVYGKNLTLFHGMEMFDERSQKLVALVLDNFHQFRDFRASSADRTADAYVEGDSKELLTLTGSYFDRFFELLKGESLEQRSSGQPVTLVERDPKVSLSLEPSGDNVELQVNAPEHLRFFGNNRSLYAIARGEILKVSRPFYRRVYPFLSDRQTTMRIAVADMPSFANFVLKKVAELIPVEDKHDLLTAYLPDELTPRFYFDVSDSGDLLLRIAYLYGEEEIQPDLEAAKTPYVKRNGMAEQEVLLMVEKDFTRQNDGGYLLSGDDAVYDFLTDGIQAYRDRGEVFITQKLRSMEVQPRVASVGVSVSDGFLSLVFDTGDFPTTELEDLYASMLQRRRYYRLRDGRVLRLEGSSYETMAEMSHMLRLTPKDLAEGKVKVPAFRALYVDSLLSNNENFDVTRNRKFRSMIRSFKSVAESDYAVPEHLDNVMRPYQKIGFQWLKTLESCNFGGILADEMGLGKTVEAIAYLSTVTRSQVNQPNLIVCPASLILNWMDEFARFGPQLKPVAIMGSAAERARLIETQGSEADVWVTSYELLRQDIKQYAELTFYCCILDEGQHVKNQTTLASKAVKQINCTQRFILTGTPIENRLSELWNLFDFLMPGYLYAHNTFVEKLEKPVVKSKDEEAMAQLRKLVQPFMLRRLKKDVLKELPPIIEHVHRIPLSENARKIYSATVLKTKATLDEEKTGSKLALLAALTKLRQICCDPNLCFTNYTGKSDKLDACLELCSGMVENGHQILLFSQFTSMLDRIRERLDDAGISNFTLQGSTTKEARARLVKEFNAGGASVFLISLKAGGTGLNLTAADVVIHYDPWWNTAAQDQATGRAHRIGQQQNVQVYKLIAQDTIEERILDLQERKAFLMDAITDESGASLLSMSREDLLALLN